MSAEDGDTALDRPHFRRRLRGVVAIVGRSCCGALALTLIASGALAQRRLPASREASLLVRALAYDRNLLKRAGKSVVIGVLYRAGDAGSRQAARGMRDAFRRLERSVKIQGLPLSIVLTAYSDPASLQRSIAGTKLTVLYVCPGMKEQISKIKTVSRSKHIVTMGSEECYVSAGLSLGITVDFGRPKVVVNVAASKAEGAAFGADLLRLAKVL